MDARKAWKRRGAADTEALLGQLDGVLEVMGTRIHLVELEDRAWVALREEDVAPCYRKGEALRWTNSYMDADTQMVAAYSDGELVAVLQTIFVPDAARKALRLAAMKLV